MAEYLKIPELARRLDVSEKTARRYVKEGVLPSVFIGGAYRVSEEDLESYLQGAKVEPGKAPGPVLQLELEEQRGADEKQGASVSKAVSEYIFNRVERHEREHEDPNSAYFRDTTAATLWLAQLNEELEDYYSWVEEFAEALAPSEELADLLMDFVNLAFPAGSFGMLIYRVEERIAAMQGQPDELAQRRAETAKARAEAGQRRVEELSERLKAG